MAYAIVINLDHDAYPREVIQVLWREIQDHMLRAGFHADGRTFVINLPAADACALARRAVDDIEDHLEYHRKHLHKYMKDFYGFPVEAKTNLLMPPTEAIEVEDIAEDNTPIG